MKDERLNALAVLNIENNKTIRVLDYKDIIEDFANKPSRKNYSYCTFVPIGYCIHFCRYIFFNL